MKRLKKWLALGLVTVMAVSVLAGCGSDSSSSSSDSDALVMATSPDFPPYESINGSGEYEGFDIELATAIAEKLGKTLEIEEAEFDSIVAGVASGKYDIGMSGITITEERKANINFSDPYVTAVQVIIVKEDSAITSADDLSSDLQIGVQKGTTGADQTTEDFGVDAVSIYNTGADAVQALISDKVDCVVIDIEPARNFVAANEGLKILDSSYFTEEYAIALNKDDEELLEQINNALNELEQDGTIDELKAKWLTEEE